MNFPTTVINKNIKETQTYLRQVLLFYCIQYSCNQTGMNFSGPISIVVLCRRGRDTGGVYVFKEKSSFELYNEFHGFRFW